MDDLNGIVRVGHAKVRGYVIVVKEVSMIEVYSLYLILIAKPRVDESNLIKDYPSMEQCVSQRDLSLLNYLPNALGEPRYTWVCRFRQLGDL